ncbi:hypothetical protein B4064_2480 [Caldibacillus thermoamylovorans]|uniref:hypothetical protein n=1 Tax=Caldibacillus thermoamylovorans TaxID=35841 RepID=UPI0005A4A4EB|nr:hypothetical protein [Caldibacillus thermoamylovorans]KIO65789.1 hypothetical protein B4064_2480 [Caldibacillus thermoamylovorans]
MESLDLKEITTGYMERMRRLALFDPLYDLERKREVDLEGKNIDMKGLGLLALLFFFENKLIRESKTGVKQLAAFLKEMTHQVYILRDEKYEEYARTIIQTFRPTHGKKRSYEYFDWEKKETGVIEYSILKANNFDVQTNAQYYTLDDDGLELIFATKEFYSEFQLSINQLILRKQLEKGEFKGALRQINEMRIDVETLEDRMEKLKHEIQRSIVSEETFERYKQLLDDIYGRLEREDEEFKELRNFVKETRERLYAQDVHKKERNAYNYILKINRELEEVHYEHSHLLDQTFHLKNTTLMTAQESLYYAGMQSFNFDQDLVSRVVSAPLPMDAMKGLLHPFLKVEENRTWSPLTVLAEQNLVEEREEKVEYHFLDVNDDNTNDPYRLWLTKKYGELMELFLQSYENNGVRTLSGFFAYLENQGMEEIYHQRYFYDFWLILHQRSPVHHGNEDETSGKTVLGEALSSLNGRVLIVTERNIIIQKVDRYSIQDMTFELEGTDDGLFRE